MRLSAAALTFGFLLGAPVAVHGQWLPALHSDTVPVLVAGASAEVLARPTRAIIYASIAGRDSDPAAATAAATATRDRVHAALRGLGLTNESVTLWGVGMGADFPIGPGRMPAQESGRPGTATRFGVRIVVDPITRLDDVLTAVARAGVEAIPLVRLEVSDASAAREEATQRAVRDARIQAEAMARAAGVRLGELRTLTTFGGLDDMASGSRFFFPGFMERGALLTPDDASVRVTVQAAWRVLPR